MDPWTSVALSTLIAAHALPTLGVLGTRHLSRLYSDDALTDPTAALLIRHRAVGFLSIAILATTALFVESWVGPAVTLGMISMVSYLVLWMLSPDARDPKADRVAKVDAVAVLIVTLALVMR